MKAIALSESSRVREINLENGVYHTNRGKFEVFVINTPHTDVPIKKGTELGRFQVCKTVEVINNEQHRCDKNEQTAQVFSLCGVLRIFGLLRISKTLSQRKI